MAITIHQVASIAGVAPSTVSRALSPSPQRISEGTRKKILRVAKELNYMPSANARLLSSRRTNTIGFFWNHGRIIDFSSSFAELIAGISQALTREKYNLLLSLRDDSGGDGWNSRLTTEKYVDGTIIAHDQDLAVMNLYRSNNIPFVLAHAQLRDDCDCILMDDKSNAIECTKYLLDLGHRRIGYVNNNFYNGHISINERATGYVEAMVSAGNGVIFPDYNSCVPVAARINQLYSNNGESPTALLCYDDEIAEEAIEALAARGLNVPDDVSIVSFNDSSTGRNRGVSLTTMRLPIMQVGQAAGKVLLERIEDEELPYKVIKHKGELIVRGSTAKVTD